MYTDHRALSKFLNVRFIYNSGQISDYLLIGSLVLSVLRNLAQHIMQTCPCNILQYLTAVKW